MKYMGSKRWMLLNGLGKLIDREIAGMKRFIDLFAGSAAVSYHVACKHPIPVIAYDLQMFSAVLAQAVVERNAKLDSGAIWPEWYRNASLRQVDIRPPAVGPINRKTVSAHRDWSSQQPMPITRAYGGHYFSAFQATWLDSLRQALPKEEPTRTVALAALVCAASQCAAAPGHTAQPFQPTRTAKPFLAEAWRKDIVLNCKDAFFAISERYAKSRGFAQVRDANDAAETVQDGDLVFIDPPYSGVHYSRFYHVLETLARGYCSDVFGSGRYPAPSQRPRSLYSLQKESFSALNSLLETLSRKRVTAIVTFPQRNCSNGLSGRSVLDCSKQHFDVERHWVASKFSTLGGNNTERDARRLTREMILVLRPQHHRIRSC